MKTFQCHAMTIHFLVITCICLEMVFHYIKITVFYLWNYSMPISKVQNVQLCDSVLIKSSSNQVIAGLPLKIRQSGNKIAFYEVVAMYTGYSDGLDIMKILSYPWHTVLTRACSLTHMLRCELCHQEIFTSISLFMPCLIFFFEANCV